MGLVWAHLVVVLLLCYRSDAIPLRGESDGAEANIVAKEGDKFATLFSVECNAYFDWQTVGLVHSYRKSGQPGPITRLLSCTDKELEKYNNLDLAPTLVVPSMTHHPRTGDWYPAINKPAGVVHWINNSPEAKDVDWVVILDADMILRSPITPWGVGAEVGKPVSAHYGYLIGCDNILAKLHTQHPDYCDKVGGFIVMHISDLRKFAPLWLSKTEEVRADTDHYATNITGDVYGHGWISEMYGYSFGAAELKLRHKITHHVMLYPGYIPLADSEPAVLHYGLPFEVGTWKWGKSMHHDNAVVDKCDGYFPQPPYPHEITETDVGKKRMLLLNIECVNTLNEGLMLHHRVHKCPEPPPSDYLTFLRDSAKMARGVQEILEAPPGARSPWLWPPGAPMLIRPPPAIETEHLQEEQRKQAQEQEEERRRGEEERAKAKVNEVALEVQKATGQARLRGGDKVAKGQRMHTLFSTECTAYFDWQTAGMMYSYKKSGHPGPITRLLSCTDQDLKKYKGMDLAPTFVVPSMTHHPNGDWYPAYNKPYSVLYWLNNSPDAKNIDFVVVLDADMILRKPIVPWELGAKKGLAVSAYYGYLIGCDNILAKLHTQHPDACPKVGGYIIQHIDDIRRHAPLWMAKTEEVRLDTAHYATNITGDVYGQGWISEMYGYSFGAAEIELKHKVIDEVMLYPGYIPEKDPLVLHYGLEFEVGGWKWDKAMFHNGDFTGTCGKFFPEPPDPSTVVHEDDKKRSMHLINIECVHTLNLALQEIHLGKGCPSQGEDFYKTRNTPIIITEGTTEEEEDPADKAEDGLESVEVLSVEDPKEEPDNNKKEELAKNEQKAGGREEEEPTRRKDAEVGAADNAAHDQKMSAAVIPEDQTTKQTKPSFMLLFSDPLAYFDAMKGRHWLIFEWTALVVVFLIMLSSLRRRLKPVQGPRLHAKTQHLRKKRLYNKSLNAASNGLTSMLAKAN